MATSAPGCSDARIAAAILALARARGVEKSVCPSEVARQLAADWRPLMPEVRRFARQLARKGELEIRQGGRSVDGETAGPIRLALPPRRG